MENLKSRDQPVHIWPGRTRNFLSHHGLSFLTAPSSRKIKREGAAAVHRSSRQGAQKPEFYRGGGGVGCGELLEFHCEVLALPTTPGYGRWGRQAASEEKAEAKHEMRVWLKCQERTGLEEDSRPSKDPYAPFAERKHLAVPVKSS